MEFFGEALVGKMWDSLVNGGIRTLFKPWATRRQGRADADVQAETLIKLARADREAADIRSGRRDPAWGPLLLKGPELPPPIAASQMDHETEALAIHTELSEAMRRVINTSRAVLAAEEILLRDPDAPTPEMPTDDWLHRWRDSAAGVSDADMQRLWGKVLAGEIKDPGKFSLRSLDFVRNLSRSEALLIESVSPFVVTDFVWNGGEPIRQMSDLKFDKLLEMQDLGLISGVGGTLNVTWGAKQPKSLTIVLRADPKVLIATRPTPGDPVRLNQFPLTLLGREILGLCRMPPNETYLRLLGEHLKTVGMSVLLADAKWTADDQYTYSNAIEL